jgi:glycosyltransferase involved in cell wall biosynthesis
MKYAIIAPNNLPIPATKGGAIETLVQNFIEINEIEKKLDIIIFSDYEKDAILLSKRFLFSKFIWRRKNWFYHFINFFLRCGRRILGDSICHLDVLHTVSKIKKLEVDKIIVEGSAHHLVEYSNYFPPEKLIFHMHAKIIYESNLFNDKVVACAHKTIVVSNYIKDEILKFTKPDPLKLFVLQNGIDLNIFNKCKDEDRRIIVKKFSIKQDVPIILFVGRIVENKGIMHLVKALIKIKSKCNLHLLITGSFGSSFGLGDGNDHFSKDLENILSENQDWISRTGFIPNIELPAFYFSADLVVVPSLCDDAAPLVPIEAMAAGKPLVITDAGGMSEYVNESCAVIVKRGDDLIEKLGTGIMELINNKEKMKLMGIEAKNMAIKYSRENYYENFIRILTYDDLFEEAH